MLRSKPTFQIPAVLVLLALLLPATARAAIEGYCWPLSVAPGGTVDFMVSSTTTYGVTMVRYARSGNTNTAIPITSLPTQPAGVQAVPSTSPWEGCGWTTSFQFTVPPDWTSGIYAAECYGTSTHRITFVVRPPDGDHAPLAMLANTNTWNAYNEWGGRSKYTSTPAHYLSFLRPNPGARPTRSSPDHLATAELWVHDWLKSSGYDFDVYTDWDFHQGIAGLQDYRALILNTHPEYWTHEMMDHLEAYLAAGGSVLYIGGNGLYERTVFSPDGTVNEFFPENYCGTLSCRKENYFRNLDPPRPEREVLGVAYRSDLFQTYAPFEVLEAGHRFFAGTGLQNGDLIGAAGINGDGASGWEMDTSIPGTAPDGVLVDAYGSSDRGSPPPNLELLARGTNTDGGDHYGADMTYYRAAGGGGVFAAGSLSFGGSLVIDPVLQQIIRNVLDEFLLGPLAVPPGARDAAPGAAALVNAPNPFAGATRIRFISSGAGNARLEVFDLSGRLVRTLMDDVRPVGSTVAVTWDGRDASGVEVPAGIYMVRLRENGGVTATRRLLRLR